MNDIPLDIYYDIFSILKNGTTPLLFASNFIFNIFLTTNTYKSLQYLKIPSTKKSCITKILSDAAFYGQLFIIKWLRRSKQITINTLKKTNYEAIRFSVINNQTEVLKYLVLSFKLTSADIKFDNCTILKWASLNGNEEILYFLTQQYSFSKEDILNKNERALRWAKNLKVTQLLLSTLNLGTPAPPHPFSKRRKIYEKSGVEIGVCA